MTITSKGRTQLLPSQVPALPYAPVQYEQRYQDQFARILTQYLTQNDNITSQVVGTSGGRFISSPHVAASYPSNQYAPANDTEAIVKWSDLESILGFTLNDGATPPYPANTATALYTGVYKIDYSLQFANSHNAEETIYVWLKVNNVNYVGSTSKFTVHKYQAGVDGYLVAYSSLTFTLKAGDYVGLYWATSRAAVSGGAVGVFMDADPAQTIGSVSLPSTPSSVGTIAFVSAVTT